jgi:CubicO group peptidase (beta-lactamase class C family)
MQQPNASEKIMENARKLPLDFPPGSKLHYSNTGYVVLGYMVQQVSGEPFARFVTDTLLKPAGMVATGIFVLENPKDLALPYLWRHRLGEDAARISSNGRRRAPFACSTSSSSGRRRRDVQHHKRSAEVELADG